MNHDCFLFYEGCEVTEYKQTRHFFITPAAIELSMAGCHGLQNGTHIPLNVTFT